MPLIYGLSALPFPHCLHHGSDAFLCQIYSSVEKFWRRQWQLTPVLLPGKSHGWRSVIGYSPWSCKESDITEQIHFHFSLSCIGEGNGNPLQYSCLENPRNGGAWWAAVYGVTQSWTLLKRLSSSGNYLHSIYFVVCMISNLEMI